MPIKVTVRGLDEFRRLLAELPRAAKMLVEESIAKYIVGDTNRGLKHYPGYKYVSVKQAGGWKSEKQRRYVMAKIREGEIDPGAPHRTGRLQRGWEYKQTGNFYTISNQTAYSPYVMGDDDQANMHGLIGWRRVSKVISDNMAGALRAGAQAINRWAKARAR